MEHSVRQQMQLSADADHRVRRSRDKKELLAPVLAASPTNSLGRRGLIEVLRISAYGCQRSRQLDHPTQDRTHRERVHKYMTPPAEL